MLNDGVNSDNEVLIVTDPQGNTLIGNARLKHPRALSSFGKRELDVVRRGETYAARVQATPLDDGNMLIVGTDTRPLEEMEHLFVRASAWTALISVFIIAVGAAGLRRMVEERAANIRATMTQVAAGHLDKRIAVDPHPRDEFALLYRDINHMLDQLQQLMDGIRNVSNTIAHNLRTPLSRMRLRLEDMRQRSASAALAPDLEALSDELMQISAMFERLLAIAEVEAGALRMQFSPVDVSSLLLEAKDLYDPLVEDQGGELTVHVPEGLRCQGDADLLASALSNLIENALKYGRQDGRLRIHLAARAVLHDAAGPAVEVSVSDQGPGVAPQDLERLTQRFFQASHGSRGLGLGLASVQAIVQVHLGRLVFENAAPGLRARMILPAA
jgi:signal transduction histidine kinase